MANTMQDLRNAIEELKTTSTGLVESVEELLTKFENGEDVTNDVAGLRAVIDGLKQADTKVEAAIQAEPSIPDEPTV